MRVLVHRQCAVDVAKLLDRRTASAHDTRMPTEEGYSLSFESAIRGAKMQPGK